MTLPTVTETYPAILRVLQRLGGASTLREVLPLVTEEFPAIAPEDVALTRKKGDSLWKNRVEWGRMHLVRVGYIDNSQRGVWALTDAGREAAQRALDGTFKMPPRPKNLKEAGTAKPEPAPEPAAPATGDAISTISERPQPSDPPGPVLPPPVAGLRAVAEPPPDAGGYEADSDEPSDDDDAPEAVAPALSVVAPHPERIAEELRLAAVDSGSPARLEAAIAEALGFLGFEAEHRGGPGQTDVVAYAELGVDRYSIVLDAKSSGQGRVMEGQIDWVTIQEHQRRERADLSCVVGPAFAAGRLPERAREYRTRLLAAEQLARIVRLHAESPLNLAELRPLFSDQPDIDAVLRDLAAASSERARRVRLLRRLLETIDNLNRAQPDAILAKPDLLLGSMLAQPGEPQGTTRAEIEGALNLLETTGILRRSNGEGYVSQTTAAGAEQILTALAGAPQPDAGPLQSSSAARAI